MYRSLLLLTKWFSCIISSRAALRNYKFYYRKKSWMTYLLTCSLTITGQPFQKQCCFDNYQGFVPVCGRVQSNKVRKDTGRVSGGWQYGSGQYSREGSLTEWLKKEEKVQLQNYYPPKNLSPLWVILYSMYCRYWWLHCPRSYIKILTICYYFKNQSRKPVLVKTEINKIIFL